MANAAFGYTNLIETGALSAGSSVSGLDISQLKTPLGSTSTSWQTAAGVATSAAGAWFVLDAGYSAQWQAFLLARTSLTSSAEIRWRVSDTPDFSTTNYDSGMTGAGVRPGYGQTLTFVTAPVTGRYMRCDIDDPSNPDGFIMVGFCYAGSVWQPASNFGWDTSTNVDVSVEDVVTRGGQEYPQVRYEQRRWNVSLPYIAQAELWGQAMEFHRISRLGGNVLFIPDPASVDVQREVVFGRARSAKDFTWTDRVADYRGWQFSITERL